MEKNIAPNHSGAVRKALDISISAAITTNDLAEGPIQFSDECTGARRAKIITASSLCCIAFEHQAAITFLVDHHRRTSAFALLRPLFDAFWRSLWIAFVANDDQVERFRQAKLDPKFETARKKLDAIPGFPPLFGGIAKGGWERMSAFTHGSGLMTQRYFSADVIAPAHADEETIELLHNAGWLALATGIVFANVVERDISPFDEALRKFTQEATHSFD